MNGMCCLGDSDDPGIMMCIGEEGGMNDNGSRSETSDDKGRRKNLAAHDSNSLWTVIWMGGWWARIVRASVLVVRKVPVTLLRPRF